MRAAKDAGVAQGGCALASGLEPSFFTASGPGWQLAAGSLQTAFHKGSFCNSPLPCSSFDRGALNGRADRSA
jgi:hypothetical protein